MVFDPTDKTEYIHKLESIGNELIYLTDLYNNKRNEGESNYIGRRFYVEALCNCDYPTLQAFAKMRIKGLKEEAKDIVNSMKAEVSLNGEGEV